ncbi:SUKH-4 family immunity protein [Streptomyces sp. NBC_01445]|uniref:SUKH-4 family immunity protein n=1 Tax=Streptomyces sp. NBC_01445 TaxID=2903869 RepID=UPI002DDB6F44|nr:SUKH-4 family immunity protein [Streptomyces sp. NBC_01445]WSE11590.1 SUKH-4 family immunity protein [Streptomyces sp. NBC_01445]
MGLACLPRLAAENLIDRVCFQSEPQPTLLTREATLHYRLTEETRRTYGGGTLTWAFCAEPGTGAVYYVLPDGEVWFANSSVALWLQSLHHYGLRVDTCDLLLNADSHEEDAVLAELQELTAELKEIDPAAFDGYHGFIEILRGYSALQGGGNGLLRSRAASGYSPCGRIPVPRTVRDLYARLARLAITKLAGSTAGLAGCQVCGAGVRLLGVPTSLAVHSGQRLSMKQKVHSARNESPCFSWGEMSNGRSSSPAGSGSPSRIAADRRARCRRPRKHERIASPGCSAWRS